MAVHLSPNPFKSQYLSNDPLHQSKVIEHGHYGAEENHDGQDLGAR